VRRHGLTDATSYCKRRSDSDPSQRTVDGSRLPECSRGWRVHRNYDCRNRSCDPAAATEVNLLSWINGKPRGGSVRAVSAEVTAQCVRVGQNHLTRQAAVKTDGQRSTANNGTVAHLLVPVPLLRLRPSTRRRGWRAGGWASQKRWRALARCCNSTQSIHSCPSEAGALAARSRRVGRFQTSQLQVWSPAGLSDRDRACLRQLHRRPGRAAVMSRRSDVLRRVLARPLQAFMSAQCGAISAKR
jgi:hypothetical protein